MSGEGQHSLKKRGTRAKRERQDGSKTIIARVTDEEHERVVELAGTMTISELIRRRVLGGRTRVHPVLRQVAALHRVGHELRRLAAKQGVPTVAILATLDRVSDAIDALAKQTPDDALENEIEV
ncbi:MAG TPA: hypothetical protein VFT56_01680 [Sphingomonas sp.]|nr:hypothetical protein [Sphingomonas sp.]